MKSIFSKFIGPLGLAISATALAQSPPNAGSLNQQIEREQIPRPAKAAPEIRIDQGATPAVPATDNQKISVKRLQITGATVYPEAALLASSGFDAPRELTLTELRGIANKIADYYRANGYFLARAYLPAQDIKDGAVTIAVLEGQYGQVNLRNSANLSDGVANRLLADLHQGDAVAIGPLENSLLLLSDIPGINVKSTLAPGASVGASDLIVEVTPGQRLSGGIDVDNQGNRYTGANRVGATLNINNPFGFGDLVSLRGQTSGSGQQYARVAYQAQIGRAKVGVAYSDMHYRLKKEFAVLQADGTASIASLYASYPLLRSRNHNLSALINLDFKTFQDQLNAATTVTNKKSNVAMASLSGDARDGFGGGGLTNYGLTWSSGSIDLQTPAVLALDSTTTRSNGHFDKLSFNAMRLQSVTETLSLYAAINGQFAFKNLDASEKIGLGGSAGVRAYPSGEAYGDQGYVINLEARALLPQWSASLPGRMQLIGFIDSGSVTLNKNPWAAGPNRRILSGAGIGLNWIDNNNFVIKATLAHKLGNAVATSAPDANTRFWLQAVKYF